MFTILVNINNFQKAPIILIQPVYFATNTVAANNWQLKSICKTCAERHVIL